MQIYKINKPVFLPFLMSCTPNQANKMSLFWLHLGYAQTHTNVTLTDWPFMTSFYTFLQVSFRGTNSPKLYCKSYANKSYHHDAIVVSTKEQLFYYLLIKEPRRHFLHCAHSKSKLLPAFFLSFHIRLLLYRRFLHVISSHYDNLRINNIHIKIDFSSLSWKDKTESNSTKVSGKV